MMAVILAGGKGARLEPFTMTIPKPLLPLGDVPILEIVIRQLAKVGFTRIVLTLGHMAHLFTATIGDGSRWGVKIEYCFEEEPLGTAGPLRLVKDLQENFLVMNGDILTTLDYRKLIATHRERKAWATIAATRREVDIDYGVIVTGEGDVLCDYQEKPKIHYDVSMGINVLSKKCTDLIPPDRKFDMPQLMMAMQQAGKLVVCCKTNCYWQDIGRLDDYQRASQAFVTDPSCFLSDCEVK